jgi:hypothetical protein
MFISLAIKGECKSSQKGVIEIRQRLASGYRTCSRGADQIGVAEQKAERTVLQAANDRKASGGKVTPEAPVSAGSRKEASHERCRGEG